MSTQFARRAWRGFTLVELLVVIGIIALLISILLPTLNSARQAAASVACLSNLRSVGQGLQFYLNDNDNYIPPAEYQMGQPGRFFQTILADTGALDGSDNDENAFMCPSGEDQEADPELGDRFAWWNPPISQIDNKGGWYMRLEGRDWVETSPDQNLYQSNYAVNAMWNTGGSAWWDADGGREPYSHWFPAGVVRDNDDPISAGFGNDDGTQLNKITEVQHEVTKVALMFDGLWLFALTPERIHLRHRNGQNSNFVFLDGHADSLRYTELPAGQNDPYGRDYPEGNPGWMYSGEYTNAYPGDAYPSQYDFEVLFFTKPVSHATN